MKRRLEAGAEQQQQKQQRSYSQERQRQQEHQLPPAAALPAPRAPGAANAPTNSHAASSSAGDGSSGSCQQQQQPRTVLMKGMVLLKCFLSEQEQGRLASEVLALGGGAHGFFDCNNEKTKHMRMMHLGRSTAPPYRDLPLAIPESWKQLAERAVSAAVVSDASLSGKQLRPANVCVVNHYTSRSRLGWHQDMLTRRDTAVPVVSLSLGDPATFHFKTSYGKKAKERSVVLSSGDALVFGGRARTVVHSVTDVTAVSPAIGWQAANPQLQGRFNVNLREL